MVKLKPIETKRDIARAMKALLAADPRLVPIAEFAGPLPLRRREGGFEGLARSSPRSRFPIPLRRRSGRGSRQRSILSQPQQFLATPEETLRAVGLSRPKIRTLTGIAAAAADGFDLIAVHDLPAEQAMATMTALKGIGPWTAEIYLLFCVGHPGHLSGRRPRAAGRRPARAEAAQAARREEAPEDRGEMVALARRRGAAVLGLLSEAPRSGEGRGSGHIRGTTSRQELAALRFCCLPCSSRVRRAKWRTHFHAARLIRRRRRPPAERLQACGRHIWFATPFRPRHEITQ